MLVLTRKSGERIRISHTISVAVLAIRGSRVKLGLTGPADVSFQREELYQRLPADRTQPGPGQHHGPVSLAARNGKEVSRRIDDQQYSRIAEA